MAKTIAQRSIELAELNATLTTQVAALEASGTELTTQLADVTAQLEASGTQVAELTTAGDTAKAEADAALVKITAIEAERDTQIALVTKQAGILALHPELIQSDGTAAIAGGDAGGTGGDAVETWAQAMKACDGDYLRARKEHPQAFQKMIDTAEPKGA